MRSIQSLLDEYGESHQNPVNKKIHWICVPLIFFCITALLYGISLHLIVSGIDLTAAHLLLMIVLIYYMVLSPSLSIGMVVFGLLCLSICNMLQMMGFVLWKMATLIFIIAWIGQFIGHAIEGKKPSFLKDVQFLLIGPAWLLSDIYKKLKITL